MARGTKADTHSKKGRRLNTATLRGDLVAGLTTAVMLIPQAMAYALLAGLPPIVGLYAAVVPLLAYALVGTSRQLAVGPVAMDSLLTAATVGALAQVGSDHYIEMAALLAILAGLIQIGLGLVRAGFLINFLSRPVTGGFTSAAALIIAASQVGLVLGLSLPRPGAVYEVPGVVWAHRALIHLPSVALAAASIGALMAMKRWAPKWPRALVVVVVGALIAWLGGAAAGLQVVGEVPGGLPTPRIPDMDFETVSALGTGALTIAFVAFMEAISVSTTLTKTGEPPVDANREFIALGLANVGAGLFRGYPVAGGFSRTAVNADAGANSKLAGVITAAAVALTLAAFTDLLVYIPKATLGAIIMTAVLGLIDLEQPRQLWKVHRLDLGVLCATFVATLVLGIQQGVGFGVGLSLLILVLRTTRPHTAVLGQLPDSTVYRNIERFPEARQIPGVLIVRPDAQLYYGNVNSLREQLAKLEVEMPDPLRVLILDASGINQLDSSGDMALREQLTAYRARGVRMVLSGAKGPVRDILERSGLMAEFGAEGLSRQVHDVVSGLDDPSASSPDAPLRSRDQDRDRDQDQDQDRDQDQDGLTALDR